MALLPFPYDMYDIFISSDRRVKYPFVRGRGCLCMYEFGRLTSAMRCFKPLHEERVLLLSNCQWTYVHISPFFFFFSEYEILLSIRYRKVDKSEAFMTSSNQINQIPPWILLIKTYLNSFKVYIIVNCSILKAHL